MIVSIITLVVVVICSASTYAWYVWNTSDDEKVKIVTNVGAATIYYDGGAAITGAKLRPVSDKADGILKTINIKSSVSGSLKFNLYLDITSLDSNLNHESFRYALYNGTSTTPITEGNFSTTYLDSNASDCTVNEGVRHIQLLTEESVTTTLTSYKLYIWIDGANYTNPTEMAGKNFSFNLHATGENAIIQEGKIPDITQTTEGSLAYNLVSLYNGAEKTEATNNGVKYYLDSTNHLMSDIAGNLRFYGPSTSVNNYIYFNCETYPETNCELWRIIGVFDGKVKIIRDASIGTIAWDQDKNQDTSKTTYSNSWETSSLQLMLNSSYYYGDTTGTITYYSGRTGSTSLSLNMSTLGLKNDVTRNLISESIWYLGGNSGAGIYPNEIYTFERTNNVGTTIYEGNRFTYIAKIGLMNASDYGYATDLSKCSANLSAYNNVTNSYSCREDDWLLNSTYGDWTITPLVNFSFSNIYVLGIASYGRVGYDLGNTAAHNLYGCRPVLYLNSEISVTGVGDGTSTNPYRINVN